MVNIPDTMRVGMYYNNSDVRLETMPVPQIGPDEILVKMVASGICGSDVLEWYRVKKAPLVLGHEIAGEIVKVGRNVSRYSEGQRVFVSHHVPCNTCRYCRRGHHTACETLHTTNYFPGGFAEYIRVPAINVDRGVFVLPDELSFEEGAFIEPLACVIRAQEACALKPGDGVLILGSGISGLLHLIAAKAAGAGRIIVTDVNDWRLETAKKFGAEEAISALSSVPDEVRRANGGRLADIVIVCAGALTAFSQALKSVDRGGTVVFFAATEPGIDLPLPVSDIWRDDIRLMPSYANSPSDALKAIDLIRSGQVSVKGLITHRLPLDKIGQGFKLVAEGNNSIKVIIHPHK